MFRKDKVFLITIIGLGLTNLGHASGFRIPEISVAGTAASNALVANSEELGAIPYNPAAAAFHEGNYAMVGVNHINYETAVTISGTRTEGTGKDSFLVPNLLVTVQGEEKLGFIMLVNAPFGLETNWPDETFPGFAGALDPLEPELSRIKMLNYSPNFSYKFDDKNSLSFGLAFYDVIDIRLNTQNIKVRGTGDGVGYTFGMMHKADNLTVGMSFKSPVSAGIKGSFDATGNGSSVISANAKIKFPSILQIGVNYKISDAMGIEFDIDRTGWSSFDEIVVANSTGTALSTSSNNWKNSNAYRLGFSYAFSPTIKMMLGYTYDESPQPDSHFSARVPDADRQLFSIGARHIIKDWTVEYAYMYVDVDDRTFNGSTSFSGDANGTYLYNGTYESDVSLIGFSASMKF